jgi:predicted restriction endonuclease
MTLPKDPTKREKYLIEMSERNRGERSPRFGKHHSKVTREKMSKSALGRRMSVEARKKMSAAKTGKKLPPFSEEHCRRISEGQRGEKAPNWRGGISFGKYCPKFNRPFRNRVRARYDYRCVECGMTQEENGKALAVHHVHYDKKTCCKEGEAVGDRKFVVLCKFCHSATNFNRGFWEDWYTEIVNEFYDGKSYLTEEEMAECI